MASIQREAAAADTRGEALPEAVEQLDSLVDRALEHAAEPDGSVREGAGVATQRIDATTRLRVVDAILSGVHEPGTSHYSLLQAFVDEETLRIMAREMDELGYRTHEFGDSLFVTQGWRTLQVPSGTHGSLARVIGSAGG